MEIGLRTGMLFTSLTTTVNVLESLRAGEPLSVTRTVITFVPRPCASVGVQLNSPLVGLIDAPAGAPESKLKVSVCVGISESVAVTVKLAKVPSLTV